MTYNPLNELLNTKQAAQRLGMKPESLRRKSRKGEGPQFVELHRHRMYPAIAVQEYRAKGR